jgi:large subunit ribosomal protein L10
VENPRPEKVAIVDEVRERLSSAEAAVLTEYRGLNVTLMAQLRRSLREAGGEYTIYKNTLVRFAANDLGLDIDELLTGPTAIAFVDGDPVNVAKALRDFARTNPALVVKGSLLGQKLLDADQTRALADVAPREELLARLAGGLAAPMVQFAGLLQALPRSFAYGLKALIDERSDDSAETADPAETAEPADTVDTAESVETAESAEPAETAEPADAADTPEPGDAEATETTETTAATDAIDASDTTETPATDTPAPEES